jgi:cytosine/adenosine deaminase-related metal-dependent hydrolase
MPDPLEPALPRIIIRNAAWLVAWDNAAQSHCYRRDVDLAIEGDTFAAIGPAAPADHRDPVEIDGRGFAILPGFVDVHAHPSSEPMLKGLTDEVGSHQLYMSSLYEYLPLFEADAEGRRAATEVALCDSAAAARERRLPLQIHAAQSVVEFHEVMRRHGRTPIGWLRQIGVLGDNAIIGHAIFLDHHSWLHWPTRDDLAGLAETGTTVAHCPTVFSRRGILLEDFGRYRAAGVNLGIGTDTFPHNFVEELRTAAILARIAAGNAHAVTAADIFTAATVGGARALGRDDLGRITLGAKADFVMVDITHPAMQPLYDPVRSMIYAAGERAVRHVFVGGQQVVRDGKALAFDYADATARLEMAQHRAIEKVPRLDWGGRSAAEIMPLTFRLG